MDPITLLLLLGGAAFFLNAQGGKKKSKTKSPGDYQITVGEELLLQLPRDAGFWTEIPIGSPGGTLKVFAKKEDPLNVARVRGESPGPVKVSFFADDARTDLVAEYMFQVNPLTAQPHPAPEPTPEPKGNVANVNIQG